MTPPCGIGVCAVSIRTNTTLSFEGQRESRRLMNSFCVLTHIEIAQKDETNMKAAQIEKQNIFYLQKNRLKNRICILENRVFLIIF